MPINGNLQTMSLAEILQWLAGGRQTGTLSVTNGTEDKKVFFENGEIVSSSTSDPKGYLGQFLLSKGVITEEILAQAMAVQEEQGGLLGEILIEGGAIDEEQAEPIGETDLGYEWEWEDSPEATLAIVDTETVDSDWLHEATIKIRHRARTDQVHWEAVGQGGPVVRCCVPRIHGSL